jgi:hypothetical protein
MGRLNSIIDPTNECGTSITNYLREKVSQIAVLRFGYQSV